MARLKAPPAPRRGAVPAELLDVDADSWTCDALAGRWHQRYRLAPPSMRVDGTLWDKAGRGTRRRRSNALSEWARARGMVTAQGFPDWHRLAPIGIRP